VSRPTRRPRRLLVVAHSFAVALNRRLVHEMSRVGGADWEVTAVAPTYFYGGSKRDLRPVPFEPMDDEPCRVETVPVHFTRWVHVFLYGFGLRRLLAEGWDLVHCWEEPYVAAGSQVAIWTQAQTPLVYTTYQNIDKRYPPPFRQLEAYAMSRASGWIAGGTTIARALENRAEYRQRPTRIIPLGVDTQDFRPDQAMGDRVLERLGWTRGGAPIVGYLGRFVPEKGVTFLMRVLDQLETPWRALFVGGGPQEPKLRAWAAMRADRVRIVTGVHHSAVPDHLNAMDILAAPSEATPRWKEQFGRMIAEAFACGLSVIANRSGEIEHVVGDAGMLCDERDEAGWIEALQATLRNESLRRSLGEAGRARAGECYAWPVVARKHLDFFDEVLTRLRRSS
jgi:phosphatidylinositol alpha-1,6-mannosyltransferase